MIHELYNMKPNTLTRKTIKIVNSYSIFHIYLNVNIHVFLRKYIFVEKEVLERYANNIF